MFRYNTFRQLSELTQEEKELADALDLLVKEVADPKSIAIASEAFLGFDYPLLYKLSEFKPSLKSFCETHEKLKKKWSEQLGKLDYFSDALISPDGKTKVSAFTQLLGAFLVNEKKKCSDPLERLKYESKVCEIGMFNSLKERIDFNLKAINAIVEKDHNINDINNVINKKVIEIFSDADKLANLYWSAGYLYAAANLLNVSNNTYSKLDRLSIERLVMTNGNIFESDLHTITLIKKAIEYSIYAQHLEHTDMSQQHIKILFPSGLLEPYAENFRDWNEAQKRIVEHVGALGIPNPDMFVGKVIAKVLEEMPVSIKSLSKLVGPAVKT